MRLRVRRLRECEETNVLVGCVSLLYCLSAASFLPFFLFCFVFAFAFLPTASPAARRFSSSPD